MSKAYGKARYTRRTEGTIRRSEKLTAAIIIAVVLVLFAIVSVIIGIALGDKADKYTVESKYYFSFEPYKSGDKTVRAVDAYAYTLGADAKGYVSRGVSDLSFCIRDAEGKLSYNSAVAASVGIVQEECGYDLFEEMAYVHALGGYACAYVYADSFKCEDEYLREVYKAYEIALIREAAECGVDDVLILGLDVTTANIAEVEKYVSEAAKAAGKAPLGVAVSRELLALTGNDVYLSSRISAVCDYLALDLRYMSADASKAEENTDSDDGEVLSELDTTLGELEYYIEAYKMRVILSKANASLYDFALDLGVSNIQIVD